MTPRVAKNMAWRSRGMIWVETGSSVSFSFCATCASTRGIDVGEGADGAGDGAGRDLRPRGARARALAAREGGVVAGELQAEGGRLGMDAVAAADGRRDACARGARRLRAASRRSRSARRMSDGLRELHGEAGVEHVRGGHALMHEARRRADMLGQVGEEGDDVVLHLALDGVDAVDLELALRPTRPWPPTSESGRARAMASQAWASISNQMRKRFSGSQIFVISGRLQRGIMRSGVPWLEAPGGRARSGFPVDPRSSPWPSSAQSDLTATRPSIRRRRPRTHNWYEDPSGVLASGFWSSKPHKADVNYTEDEVSATSWRAACGSPDLVGQGRGVQGFGDAFVIPGRFKGAWETVEAVKKFLRHPHAEGVSA